MRAIKLTIAYDGTDFAGWQWQAGQRTVQGELETALAKLTGETMRVTGSGRTDSGVHAAAQVVSFTTESPLPVDVFPRALNATLPHDIAVIDAAEVPLGFHAIRAAKRKRYRYVLHDAPHHDVFLLRYGWHIRQRLDTDVMQHAARQLVGTHDFASFQTGGSVRKTTVRTVYDASVTRPLAEKPHVIHFEVEANGFLYNMVRVMIGTLVDIGRGFQPRDWIAELLGRCDRNQAGMTAPAQGLVLLRVDYGPDAASDETTPNEDDEPA
ncbi:MAG: tRNA pseudouridine(38-40) synthase TruA [Planctomycetaceae bacterium]|nr:tRNA pseudouridine(38-40) synthase TruA [Planctomycetaceae bacterium]